MRHCAANIIEHGGGVGPIAADCLQRLGRRETTLSADEAILDSALAVGAMADFTIVSIDLLAVRDGTAALRQTRAVRPDINVPQLDLVWRRRPAEIIRQGMTGTWKEEGNAAVITWKTGWTTKITNEGGQYKKTAYRKGQPLDAPPDNSSDAERAK